MHTPPVSRRHALGTIIPASTLALSALANAQVAGAADPSPTGAAFRGAHKPRELPFDPAKLRGISEKVIRSHWENNYQGAMKTLNQLEQRLDAMMKEKDFPAFAYGNLKREELMRTGSVILHEHYFFNLGGETRAAGEVLTTIQRDFGSYEAWESEFRRLAASLAGGSGWVILNYNLHTGTLHNYWAGDHMHNAPVGKPIVVLDMYEHSYHMDYGAAAAKYIDAFMQNINWEAANRRLVNGQKAGTLIAEV
jgi:Fe-Mn family superoxide dismutase